MHEALKAGLRLDLTNWLSDLVSCYQKYPLQDMLLQQVTFILSNFLHADDNPTLMHLLFQTEFCNILVA